MNPSPRLRAEEDGLLMLRFVLTAFAATAFPPPRL